MIKAVIFDCFGVLVGSGFKETYAQAGGDPRKDQAFIDDLLDKVSFGRITHDEMAQRVAEKLGISVEKWLGVVAMAEQPKKELLAYIQQLRPKYKTAILSNANFGSLERHLSPEQLDLFNVKVVSADVGMIKPDPGIYQLTFEKLGVLPEESIFIDDNERYCEAARAMGTNTIYYDNFQQMKSELNKLLAEE